VETQLIELIMQLCKETELPLELDWTGVFRRRGEERTLNDTVDRD